MSIGYCFEKLYEAIKRPESGHLELALGEHSYIDQILKSIERFKNPLKLEGRSGEYQSVVDKLTVLKKYFEEYPNTSITKQDAHKLEDYVFKQVPKWNNGTFPD